MEVVKFVSEAELEQFPEEAPKLTDLQEQSDMTLQPQSTVKSLLLADTSPSPELLNRIHRDKVTHLLGNSPNFVGGSGRRPKRHKVLKHPTPYRYNKQPQLLVVYNFPGWCK